MVMRWLLGLWCVEMVITKIRQWLCGIFMGHKKVNVVGIVGKRVEVCLRCGFVEQWVVVKEQVQHGSVGTQVKKKVRGKKNV